MFCYRLQPRTVLSSVSLPPTRNNRNDPHCRNYITRVTWLQPADITADHSLMRDHLPSAILLAARCVTLATALSIVAKRGSIIRLHTDFGPSFFPNENRLRSSSKSNRAKNFVHLGTLRFCESSGIQKQTRVRFPK